MSEGMHLGAGSDGAALGARHEHMTAMAYVASPEFGVALRDGLVDWLPDLEVRRGGIRGAINALRSTASPRILIVDVDEEEFPLPALRELSTVVTPDTDVLVVGNACRRSEDRSTHDLALYREITRGLGATEYLPEPLTPDLVRRYFGPIVCGEGETVDRAGGRLITITGVRGGVGASVIAASLAWYCGEARRHSVLLDADLTRGTASLLLDTDPGDGLWSALLEPERIDTLLAERAARPVAERLHLLASASRHEELGHYAPGAGARLLTALRQRYGLIIADAPWNADPFCRELFTAAHHRILVLTPTLPSARDAVRLRAMPSVHKSQPSTTLVLNRSTMQGGLKRSQIEEVVGHPVQISIPDLPRQISDFVSLGQQTTASSFRNAVADLGEQIGVGRPKAHGKSLATRWHRFGRA